MPARPSTSHASDPPRGRARRPWTLAYPPELPVSARKDEILAALRASQVVIVSGDTGSGKTTQLPKICLEAGRERIACTQPRRVAAVSLSRRVAEELGVTWGREVGCKIRFMDETSRDTAVKFLTDGMLLAEVQADPMLRAYDTIIVDEAHERSLVVDFLLGHLVRLRQRRPELRIVVTSATIDTAAFSRAFDGAPVVHVSGRLFPIETIYSPVDARLEESGDFTHLDAVAAAVERILLESDGGDILVFLATERDIREAADLLAGRALGPLEILPLFGRLAGADQQRVFAPARHRKVVLATNIAETSLTIPGIRFVVDTGEARVARFDTRARTRRLPIEPISRSSADQRKGRCGRVGPGVCIRLYSEEDYAARPEFAVPEIRRANLADVILRMKTAGLGDIERFPFLDPPPAEAVRAGYALLEELGALDQRHEPTPLGRDLARLPVDPIVGRMLCQAIEEGAVREVLVLAAALAIQDPRERPADAEAQADTAHRRFVHPDSDFLTLLAIWDAFHDDVETLSQGRLRKFCRAHFLGYHRMREWRDLHAQLAEALDEAGLTDRRADRARNQRVEPADMRFGGVRYRAIHRSLLPGLLGNVARREDGNLFRAGGERKVVLFPGSTLFRRKAVKPSRERTGGAVPRPKGAKGSDWIVAAEVVETTRLYARTCARIDPDWLLDLGAHVCRVSHGEPSFTAESGRVLARETTRLHGLEVRVRSVGYGKIDPRRATEIFIREGLLGGELRVQHGFLEHNRAVRDKAEVLRTRLRAGQAHDLDEALFRFYAERLAGVSSVHDLDRVARERIGRDPDFLRVREDDLLGGLPEDFDRAAFPDTVPLGNSALPLRYAYRPGREEDGVTLRLEAAKAKKLREGMLDWLVPGLLEEKIACLLRTLPKDLRRPLLPLAGTAAAIARELRPTHPTLVESLAAFVERRHGLRTVPSDWNPEEVPQHLRVRVEVVGAGEAPIAAGRDVARVQEQVAEREREAARRPDAAVAEAWRRAAAAWEKTGLETWTFEALPERVAVAEKDGLSVSAYPGLRVEPGGVALRLFPTPEEARRGLDRALEHMFAHELRYELSWLDRDLNDVARLGPLAASLGPVATLKEHVREHLRRFLCGRRVEPLERAAFLRVAAEARAECKGLLFRLLDRLQPILQLRLELAVAAEKPPYSGFERDLARLVPPDLLLRTSYEMLPEIPRYLRAMQARVRKARENPVRDRQRAAAVARLEQRVSAADKAGRLNPAVREKVSWMLEEWRVSVFAQEIGTAFPVSEKRIEKLLAGD